MAFRPHLHRVCGPANRRLDCFSMRKLTASVFTVCLGLASLCAMAPRCRAQKPSQPATHASCIRAAAPVSTAKPGDVDTSIHIIAAVYDVISGPAGPRDWDRFRSLFYSGARLIPSRRDDKGALDSHGVLTR